MGYVTRWRNKTQPIPSIHGAHIFELFQQDIDQFILVSETFSMFSIWNYSNGRKGVSPCPSLSALPFLSTLPKLNIITRSLTGDKTKRLKIIYRQKDMIKELISGKAGSSTSPEKGLKKWSLTCPPCSNQTGFLQRFNVWSTHTTNTTFPSCPPLILIEVQSAPQSPDQYLFPSGGLSLLSLSLARSPHLLNNENTTYLIRLRCGTTGNANHSTCKIESEENLLYSISPLLLDLRRTVGAMLKGL